MPNPGFQFQNVGGAGVAQAAESQARQQNQAFDRVEKGLQGLAELGGNRAEREQEQYNAAAEKNLQAELNKIKNIGDVDVLANFEIDEDALKTQYGSKLGGESFEQGVGALQAAVDARLNEIVNKEEVLDKRTDRIEENTSEKLLQDFRLQYSNLDTRGKLNAVPKFLAQLHEQGIDVPARSFNDFQKNILDASRAKEFTPEEKQRFNRNKQKALGEVETLDADIGNLNSTLDTNYGGINTVTPATFADVDATVEGMLNDDGAEFEGGIFAFDATKDGDYGTYKQNATEISKEVISFFGGINAGAGGAKITDALTSNIQRDIDENRKRLSAYQNVQNSPVKNKIENEIVNLEKRKAAVAKDTNGIIFSKKLLGEVLSDEIIFDADTWGKEGQFNSDVVAERLREQLADPNSRLYKSIINEGYNQREAQKILTDIKLTKKAQAEAKGRVFLNTI